MTHNISYFDCINASRNDGLSDIQNARVKSFWKSTIINLKSFNDIECDVVQEVLIEEYQNELKERKSNKSKRLTKIKLTKTTPENADYISVSHGISHSIVPIKDSIIVEKHPDYSVQDVNDKLKATKLHLEKHSKDNDFFSITKWV